MLLELADWMARHFTTLHLFQYITFRTIMAALTALAVSLLLGPALIRKLAALKAGQVVRSDGPQTHLSKAGTRCPARLRLQAGRPAPGQGWFSGCA